MRTRRRTAQVLAAPGIDAARQVYLTVPSDALRVAALVEIAAAAAALARTVVRLRHLDPDLITVHVTDPVDLRAVLGRGRWLPTMTRHVPAPPSGPIDSARCYRPCFPLSGPPGCAPPPGCCRAGLAVRARCQSAVRVG